MPKVYWLIRAQRMLMNSLAGPATAAPNEERFRDALEKFRDLLERTFPESEVVIVRDCLQGYRPRRGYDVLLVEVIPVDGAVGDKVAVASGSSSAYIVKVSEPTALAAELAGWESCRPKGLVNDGIFVPLGAGALSSAKKSLPETLVYGDAFQTIGAGHVTLLEDAFLTSCVQGVPVPESIDHVFRDVFGRLENLFYSRAYVPDRVTGMALLSGELKQWLEPWNDAADTDDTHDELVRCRRETYGFLSRKPGKFLDPCDYLASVMNCPEHAPRMVRGCSHGDLHGRNVLVSQLEGEAACPSVYDYEDMHPDNLIGFDFVKLETELKVRALQKVFTGAESRFVEQVLDFEIRLAERTEKANNDDEWRGSRDTALERLEWLILRLRRRAKRHLGTYRQRERDWLEEYYFLLASYGVRAARYETYQRRHIICAYISAGVAAGRLSRPWLDLEWQLTEMKSRAGALLRCGDATAPDDVLQRPASEMSHHSRFAFAIEWSRSGQTDFMTSAVEILEKLRGDYPHVLEIDEELALIRLNLGHEKEVEKILYRVNQRYSHLHEETYCRWGRLWKDRAQKILESTGESGNIEARSCLLVARNWYQKAYDVRGNYYPGINVAALHFLLGEGQTASVLAGKTIDSLADENSTDANELMWPRATRAEAEFLRGDNDLAKEAYRAAVAAAHAPQAKATMRRQLELLLRFAGKDAQEYWSDETLADVFGNDEEEGTRAKAEAPMPQGQSSIAC